MEEVVKNGVEPRDEFCEVAGTASAVHRVPKAGVLHGLWGGDEPELGEEAGDVLLSSVPRKGALPKESRVTAKALLKLIESQGYVCALSGVALTPESAAIDHKIPISRGGAHDIGNLQVLHENVNMAKRNMLPEEFIDMCVKVAKYARRV